MADVAELMARVLVRGADPLTLASDATALRGRFPGLRFVT